MRAFLSNAGSLRHFLRRFFESGEDVEDLLQETFVKSFEAERSTDIAAPRAFLFKTARNLTLNELMRRTRRKTVATVAALSNGDREITGRLGVDYTFENGTP